MEQELKNKIQQANRNDYNLMVKVTGKWLIKEGLTDTWKQLRKLHELTVIDEDYEDWITLFQAEMLGLIEKC